MRSFLLLGFFGRLIAGQAAGNTLVDCGQVCELDALGQRLTFPGSVVTKTVIATTASIVTYKDLVGSIIVQTTTKLADLPPVTWQVSGVTLTYPTTYVIYTDLTHSFVATKTAGGSLACSTGASSLDLGPSTDFSSLVFPASEVVGTLPPSALVGYLESIPTVLAQLGGTVNSSCDPIAAVSTSSSGPILTLSTTNTLSQVTTITAITTVSGQFATMSGSELTFTSTVPPFGNRTTSAPPPPTSTTITTSQITLSSTSTLTSTSTLSSSSSSSTISSSTTTFTSNTTTLSSVTATITSTSTPPGAALTTVTFTGAISSLESSPPGNLTATATSPTSSGIELSNVGNKLSTGGWLASILGLAVYWL